MNAAAPADALAAIEHPLDGPGLAVTGPARSGKTYVLLARARRASELWREGPLTLVTAPAAATRARLAAALEGAPGLAFAPLEELAYEILDARADRAGIARPSRIDDARAAAIFEPIGASLFALEWGEFVNDEIDPEITGLRAPERFAAAALRLIRKLRAGAVSPEAFRRSVLQGATKFYAHPPNLASTDLITETPAKYRDSLRAGPDELARQHAREVDLGKILAKLYDEYVGKLVERGCLTPADATIEAIALLQTDARARAGVAARWRGALIDEAQDLTGAQIAFVAALFGSDKRGVTFAGDERVATQSFAGARGDAAMREFPAAIALPPREGMPLSIARAAETGAASPARARIPNDGAFALYRGSDKRDEAAWIASEASALAARGVPLGSIAVVTRDLRCASIYLDALLARGIATDLEGRADLFELPVAGDVLALLWALADPYRHDWLLRALEGPAVGLADASLATLCGEPSNAQAPLFEMPDDEPIDETRGRWDRRRDLRLAHNVAHGDTDVDLPDDARLRLESFRARLERYARLERELDLPELVATVARDVVGAANASAARARFDANVAARIVRDAERFSEREPLATLHDYLLETERASEYDGDLRTIEARDPDAVALLDVESAKGRSFAHVFVADVRAGAFPQYYVPEAFLFQPSYGMIAKENVGDASSARTAKFSFVSHRLKLRERFVQQERRAFYTAATRATERLYVGTSGRPTKGVSAPEIAAELLAAFDG